MELAVAEPAEDFREGGALAVHEDADSIEAGREPQGAPYGDEQEADRSCYLPDRGHLQLDARQHDIRRGEREERCGDGPDGIGIFHQQGESSHAHIKRDDG